MIKLKKLILEVLNKSEIGKKFFGTVDQLVFQKNLQESETNNKIEVINKKSGVSYFVTKKWYQKHKELYSADIKTNKKSSNINNKFLDNKDQIKKQNNQFEPKNAKEFIKEYMWDDSQEYLQLIQKTTKKQAFHNYQAVQNLGDKHISAINYYTENGYLIINDAIRNNFKELKGTWTKKELENEIKLIKQSLSKCESYDGVCVRFISTLGDYSNFNLNLRRDSIFHCEAFTSATYDYTPHTLEKLAKKFLRDLNDNYVFYIKSKNGKNIDLLSAFENEQKQILFDTDSKFKIIDVEKGYLYRYGKKILVKKVYAMEI